MVLLPVLADCNRSVPANVAAMVNNRSITYAELDKQYQFQFPAAPDKPKNDQDDQSVIQHLEVLRTLIDGEVMLPRAEKPGPLATDPDGGTQFTGPKKPYTQEDFKKQLNARKMTAEDLKSQIRRDLSVQKLFTKEITSQIAVSDKDISDFYDANVASFNRTEPQIHMAQ